MKHLIGGCCLARAESEDAGESGFSLVELLVVLLIMGILLAIAVPTYLSATGNARNTTAKQNVRGALTEAQSYYAANSSFSSIASHTKSLGTTLNWETGTVTAGDNQVGVESSGRGNSVLVWSLATNGNCYALVDDQNAAFGPGSSIPPAFAGVSPSGRFVASHGIWYGDESLGDSATCTLAEVGKITNWQEGAGSWPNP